MVKPMEQCFAALKLVEDDASDVVELSALYDRVLATSCQLNIVL